MHRIRLLALDLDGTLLTEDKKIPESTKYYVRKAVDAGICVIFATGRGYPTAAPYWEALGLTTPMVLANGADIRTSPDRSWQRHYIPGHEIRKLHALANRYDAWFWGYNTESLVNRNGWTEDMFEHDWFKFGIRHDDPGILKTMWDTIKQWGTLEVTQSAPVNMEISAKGVSKESGVREICRLLGIRMEEVAAVGDSRNDIGLLKAAGLGVAMGNAAEEVKQIADLTTASNEEEGVAKLIQQLLDGSVGRADTKAI